MAYAPSKNEKTILEALTDGNATDEGSAMTAAELQHRCAGEGLKGQPFEMALMNVIDHDLVEYDMDDNAQASAFWLLELES